MKDPRTREHARCRNSNLNEDLGKARGRGWERSRVRRGGGAPLFPSAHPSVAPSWRTVPTPSHKLQVEYIFSDKTGTLTSNEMQAGRRGCRAGPSALSSRAGRQAAWSHLSRTHSTPHARLSRLSNLPPPFSGPLPLQLRQIAIKGQEFGSPDFRLEERRDLVGLKALRRFDRLLHDVRQDVAGGGGRGGELVTRYSRWQRNGNAGHCGRE